MNALGWLVVLTFATVVVLIIGAYWTLVLQPEDREQKAVRSRLKGERRAKAMSAGLLKDTQARLSQLNLIDTLLQRLADTSPIQTLITGAGINTTVSVVLLSAGCAGLVAALGIWFTSHRWYFAVPVGLIAAYIPIAYLRFKRDQRVRKFEEQFPEAIDLIARALRAGHAFTTALSMVPDELEDPVGTEFRILFERQNFGMPLSDALREFAARVPVLDAKFLATAVLTQREAGGNLAEVLDNLSSVIRERFKIKRQVRVVSAHGRITGWILALLPPFMALAFMIVSPGHLDRLVNDTLGVQMILGALVLQVIGTLLIRRIVRVEY